MLHMTIVRSPHSHAMIKDIDTSKALIPGVVGVFTSCDLASVRPIPVDYVEEGSKPVGQPVLAGKRVRYVGEGVAAVLAGDEYLAYDAAELVEVAYDPQPPVVDPLKAISPGSPLVHEELGSNLCFRWARSFGDVNAAFAVADEVVKFSLRIQRLAPAPIETRGVVASFDSGSGVLSVWSSTQSPHSLRKNLSEILGLGENMVRIIAPDVGGAFGAKYNCYPEDVLASYLSMEIGKPVKWVEGRGESLHCMSHGRDMHVDVEAAVRREGRVEGLKVRIVGDLGAYNHGYTQGVPIMAAKMVQGCYRIKNLELEVLGVYTNKMTTNAYRGAGRPEASYIIERTMDHVARRLGLDPSDIRRVNFVNVVEFPYKSATGYLYDSGNYEKTLERALDLSGYWRFRREQVRLRAQGRLLGIGLSSYVEVCNFAYQAAQVRVDSSGRVYVLTSTSPHGQGVTTALAQIASEILGIPMRDIMIIHGDTLLVPEGPGTAGSWSLTSGGNAVYLAASDVREKMLRIAAHILEANPDDLVIGSGRIYVRGSHDTELSLENVAKAAYDPDSLPKGMELGLVSTRFYTPDLTFPFGTHVAVVEVDAETGQVFLKKVVMVNDCGQIVNPLLAEGQVHGGAAQAIGQALSEEHVYDEVGTLLTSSLSEYLMPNALDIPMMETDWTVTPAPNALGSKGVGEAATVGMAQAIVNAVEDALSHLGIEVINTPLTPFRVMDMLRRVRPTA